MRLAGDHVFHGRNGIAVTPLEIVGRSQVACVLERFSIRLEIAKRGAVALRSFAILRSGARNESALLGERGSIPKPGHGTLRFEICQAIRSADSQSDDVPVVLVAAEEDRSRRSESGITDWLVKPFTEVYARTKLHAWLMRTACRWMRAPLPRNEDQRLAALHGLGILDTAPEDRLDRIGRVAAALFDVPSVLITVIDKDRQWFKTRVGLEVQETSREVSFCAHAILGTDVMLVPDTLLDDRFADNPLVTGEPRIRFYAGCPLALDDEVHVGTLCLLDARPQQLDGAQVPLARPWSSGRTRASGADQPAGQTSVRSMSERPRRREEAAAGSHPK